MPPSLENPQPLSPEQFRQMLAEALADPNLARRVLMPLTGTVFPIQGGVPATVLTVQDDGKVGIGTATPVALLHVEKNQNASTAIVLSNPNTQSSALTQLQLTTNSGSIQSVNHYLYSPNWTGDSLPGLPNANLALTKFESGVGDVLYRHAGTKSFNWSTYYVTEAIRMTLTASGNLGIGTTDKLSRLTVKGRASFTAAGTVSTTASSTTVTGTGTSFTKEVGIGDRITVVDISQTRTVTAITDDTHLTVDKAFTANEPSSNMTVLPSIFRADDSTSTAPANVKLLVSDQGSLVLSGAATKQVSGGPELISAQGSSQDNVVLWAGLTTDTEGRFLFSYRGFLEWGPGGTGDQDIALYRNGPGGISIENFTGVGSDRAFSVNAPVPSLEIPVFAVDTTKNKTVRVVKAKLTVKGAYPFNADGTVSVTSPNFTTVVGTGTTFRTQVRVGDRITINNETRTVVTITDDTHLTVDSNLSTSSGQTMKVESFNASGTVSVTSGLDTVTGTGTSFTTEVGLGDRITVLDINQTRTVIEITSDSSLKVDLAFSASDSSSVMSVIPSIFRADDASGVPRLIVSDEGRVASGAPSSEPTNGSLNKSSISFWLDENAHKLMVKVKYSNGTTVKKGNYIVNFLLWLRRAGAVLWGFGTQKGTALKMRLYSPGTLTPGNGTTDAVLTTCKVGKR